MSDDALKDLLGDCRLLRVRQGQGPGWVFTFLASFWVTDMNARALGSEWSERRAYASFYVFR
jgi:hypothetical protein